MTAPRDVSELLWPAVQETIHALGLGSSDAALVKLVQRQAQVIDGLPEQGSERTRDQAWGLRWIGPELLKSLDALGATPEARARISRSAKGGGDKPADAAPSQLDALRASRASRRTP